MNILPTVLHREADPRVDEAAYRALILQEMATTKDIVMGVLVVPDRKDPAHYDAFYAFQSDKLEYVGGRRIAEDTPGALTIKLTEHEQRIRRGLLRSLLGIE